MSQLSRIYFPRLRTSRSGKRCTILNYIILTNDSPVEKSTGKSISSFCIGSAIVTGLYALPFCYFSLSLSFLILFLLIVISKRQLVPSPVSHFTILVNPNIDVISNESGCFVSFPFHDEICFRIYYKSWKKLVTLQKSVFNG